jgi:hypothetical protein
MFKRFVTPTIAAGLIFMAPLTNAETHSYSLNLPPQPTVGSTNEATADLRVSHPDTQPCIVPLFQNQSFTNFTPKPIDYAPPANCPSPWAKVVFVGDFSVTPGRQFDRTAYLFLGHANIFYGTTPEPSSTHGPSWEVQRDVTDLSSFLESPHTGSMNIGNIVNSTYTGIIKGSGSLYFYPYPHKDHSGQRSRSVPSLVVPLNGGNGPALLRSGANVLSKTLTLPTNMTNLYLDVIAQSQIGDEFWYSCVPDSLAGELESCGGTGFRQVEVFIDGSLAGLAPVSPWVYTGGVDPFLWTPIPGVQTLNFKPYRVNLTPFAGELDDGATHTIGVAVYSANNYFLVSAKLLAFQDSHVTQFSGAVLEDSVPAPNPTTSNSIEDSGGNVTGSFGIASNPTVRTSGYISSPQGVITTTVTQKFNFSNNQSFDITSSLFEQDIGVTNSINTRTTRIGEDGDAHTSVSHWSFPLSMDITLQFNADGSISQTTRSEQRFENTESSNPHFLGARRHGVLNDVKTTDTLNFSPSFSFLGNSNASSSQHFEYEAGAPGHPVCYNRTNTSASNVVVSSEDSHWCNIFTRNDHSGNHQGD